MFDNSLSQDNFLVLILFSKHKNLLERTLPIFFWEDFDSTRKMKIQKWRRSENWCLHFTLSWKISKTTNTIFKLIWVKRIKYFIIVDNLSRSRNFAYLLKQCSFFGRGSWCLRVKKVQGNSLSCYVKHVR